MASMKCNKNALGLAIGILWGAIMFFGTLLASLTGYATAFYRIWGSIYPGYGVSLVGSLLGLVYGFIDGFIGGWLIAWLYDRFA